jgi:hypothetical protein
MNKLKRGFVIAGNFLYVSKLEVSTDVDAERLLIIDRSTFEVIIGHTTKGVAITTMILPVKYSSSSNLCAMIFDDGGEYNAAIVDGITAELFDANT